jgi:hypothetical protein
VVYVGSWYNAKHTDIFILIKTYLREYKYKKKKNNKNINIIHALKHARIQENKSSQNP